MKRFLLLTMLLCTFNALTAQYVYTIKADSVKITNNCDTAELILENHTQNVLGFLYNKGKGRTEFRKGLIKLNDTLFLIGSDSLSLGQYWKQGGNRFGVTGILGTKDNHHVDMYTKDTIRARWTNTGNLLINTINDNGYKLQVAGTGIISINPVLSRANDRIRIGSFLNTGDGQNAMISTSNDGGGTWRSVLVERDGHVGIGQGSPIGWNVGTPPVRVSNAGVVSFMTAGMYFGNTPGPINASALVTSVSNTNEWNIDAGYPSGQNYYSIATVLNTPTPGDTSKKRAPLHISGRELQFFTSTANNVETARITQLGNLLVGTTNDIGSRLYVNGRVRATGNDIYDIHLIPQYGNGWSTGVNASMIAFGNIHASLGVNKQALGNIPAESMIIGVTSPGKITTIVDYGRNPTFVVDGGGQVTLNGGYSGITTGGTVGADADRNGTVFNINGSRGTGSGTTGDIVFATANSTASGTTIHSITNRWWIKGGTGYLSNNSNPTAHIDINGANGYGQLRLRTTYTPSSTSDSNGNVGDFSWDDNYFYIKTSGGWKRSALTTF